MLNMWIQFVMAILVLVSSRLVSSRSIIVSNLNDLHVNSIRRGCIILKPGATKPPKYLKEEAPFVQNFTLTDIKFIVCCVIVFKFVVWDAIVIETEGQARIYLLYLFFQMVVK